MPSKRFPSITFPFLFLNVWPSMTKILLRRTLLHTEAIDLRFYLEKSSAQSTLVLGEARGTWGGAGWIKPKPAPHQYP